ncbi:hypothetical protein X975_01538, partial [Stegodyphus mimosarum]
MAKSALKASFVPFGSSGQHFLCSIDGFSAFGAFSLFYWCKRHLSPSLSNEAAKEEKNQVFLKVALPQNAAVFSISLGGTKCTKSRVRKRGYSKHSCLSVFYRFAHGTLWLIRLQPVVLKSSTALIDI